MPKRLPRTLGDSANRLTLSKEVPVRFTARPVALALAASLSAVALVGCSPANGSCENPLGEGSANLVSVSGPFGSTPIVDFPTPFVGRDASTSTVIPGTGDVIESGYYVDFEATVYGEDESVLTATAYGADGAPAQRIPIEAGSNAISDSFLCHSAGERFTLTGTAAEIFGATSGSGTDPNTTVVVVFDVINAIRVRRGGFRSSPRTACPPSRALRVGAPGLRCPTLLLRPNCASRR
jgi:hypothetical protein